MYHSPRIITEPVSNNRLHFDEREKRSIFVPSLIEGTLDDVQTGEETVIEGEVGGKIIAGKGLRHFVYLKNARVPTWICDNHNHAFAFWHDAFRKGYIKEGSLLVHIDQHTDLATPQSLPKHKAQSKNKKEGFIKNSGKFPPEKGGEMREGTLGGLVMNNFGTLEEIEVYTNTVLTIADFIVPALATGLLSEAMMITGEDRNGAGIFQWQSSESGKEKEEGYGKLIKNPPLSSFTLLPSTSIIVDIDLDYFSQGFDDVKTMETTRYWIAKADIITIATSPLFIDQEKALQVLKSLQKDLVTL